MLAPPQVVCAAFTHLCLELRDEPWLPAVDQDRLLSGPMRRENTQTTIVYFVQAKIFSDSQATNCDSHVWRSFSLNDVAFEL